MPNLPIATDAHASIATVVPVFDGRNRGMAEELTTKVTQDTKDSESGLRNAVRPSQRGRRNELP